MPSYSVSRRRASSLCGCLWLAASACAVEVGDPMGSLDADDALDEARFAEIRDRAAVQFGDRTIYNVEWDLWFETEGDLRDYLNSDPDRSVEKLAVFRQLSNGYEPTFDAQEALSLEYCVSDTYAYEEPKSKARVVNEMAAATRAWEEVANVRFRYVPEHDGSCNQYNDEVDFAVIPGSIPAFCAANKLGLPTWSCPITGWEYFGAVFFGGEDPVALHQGVLVTAYGDYPKSALPKVTTTGVLKHELGHILGMRHEHIFADLPQGLDPACYLDRKTESHPAIDLGYRRLTDVDRESVMYYPQCDGYPKRDFQISALDGVGARKVYGQPASWYVPII